MIETGIALDQTFQLESGAQLPRLRIAYETYGSLNAECANAILVCHALTGSAHAGGTPGSNGNAMPGWWDGLIGRGKALDTSRYFVICSNILGSCYGTTGPSSIDPQTTAPYRMAFPAVTVRDMVRAQHQLLKALGVEALTSVIGGSLGGMQVLEWAIMYPDFVRSVIPVATSAQHSAWCIAFDEAQRLAITSDPAWQGGEYEDQPSAGLAIARMIAMISYRSRGSFESRFGRGLQAGDSRTESPRIFRHVPFSYQIESYLRYQGQKLVDRFDANSYLCLTRAMDLHDVGAGRGGTREALGSIRAPALCIGIDSDILYPASEQRLLSESIPGGTYREIRSIHGHDAFLIEYDQLNGFIRPFLESITS